MTIRELIEQLSRLDDSSQVWVDTSYGLFPVNYLYEDSNTAIIMFAENNEPPILN